MHIRCILKGYEVEMELTSSLLLICVSKIKHTYTELSKTFRFLLATYSI